MMTTAEITYFDKNGAELPRAEAVVSRTRRDGSVHVKGRRTFHAINTELAVEAAKTWATSFGAASCDVYESRGEDKRRWLDPAKPHKCNIEVRCCGEWIACNAFTVTCDDCGADYNMSGHRLAPRSQWGEETGEHWTDCY